MYPSPSMRLFSQENSGSVMARKPGTAHEVSRLPFGDRSVNFCTPSSMKKLPSLQLVKNSGLKLRSPNGQCKRSEDAPQLEREQKLLQKCPIGDDLINDDFSSCVINPKMDFLDDFADICPESDRFTKFDSFNLLKAYCGYKNSSAPSSPLIDHSFEFESYKEIEETSEENDSGLFDELEISSCDDVSLPDLSLDED